MTEPQHVPGGVRETRNVVAIHDVGDDGSTGPQAGTGVLVRPELVLVHPPLAAMLATGRARALRTGISSGLGPGRTVEVIDVAGIHVSALRTSQPLVALALRAASASAIDPLGATGPDDVVAAVIAYLESLATRPAPPPAPAPPVNASTDTPYCGVWPNSPGCPR